MPMSGGRGARPVGVTERIQSPARDARITGAIGRWNMLIMVSRRHPLPSSGWGIDRTGAIYSKRSGHSEAFVIIKHSQSGRPTFIVQLERPFGISGIGGIQTNLDRRHLDEVLGNLHKNSAFETELYRLYNECASFHEMFLLIEHRGRDINLYLTDKTGSTITWFSEFTMKYSVAV